MGTDQPLQKVRILFTCQIDSIVFKHFIKDFAK